MRITALRIAHFKSIEEIQIKNIDAMVRKYVLKSGVDNYYTLRHFRNRAIVDFIHAGSSIDDIADYTGLTKIRPHAYIKAAEAAKTCPADLVNYRII